MPDSDLVVHEGEEAPVQGSVPRPDPAAIAEHLASQTQPEPEAPKIYDETFVKSLQDENYKWRQRAHQYEQAFEGTDDAYREAILEFGRLNWAAQHGDQAAIDELTAAGFWEQADEESQQPEVDQPQFMTRNEIEAMFAEREARAAEQANMSYLHSQARGLGYEPDTDEYDRLVSVARRIGDSNLELNGKSLLEAAHERIQEQDRKRWEEYTQSKVNEAGNSILLPPTNGQAPVMPSPPARSREEVRERALLRLRNGA